MKNIKRGTQGVFNRTHGFYSVKKEELYGEFFYHHKVDEGLAERVVVDSELIMAADHNLSEI